MRLAVIPARGGSKRIPRKNIRMFCGKPMIAWSIEAARASGCFDRIVVSTDDEEIAEVARGLGVEVPFMRPAALSDDYTGTIPVVRHAMNELLRQSAGVTHVCCVYATAPFLRPEDIRRGWELLQESKGDYAFSITDYAFPIQRALRMTEGRVQMLQPEMFDVRSQDLERIWHDAGQFYWGTAEAWEEQRVLFSSCSYGVVLPRHRVQDIDTAEDWHIAEILHRLGEELAVAHALER